MNALDNTSDLLATQLDRVLVQVDSRLLEAAEGGALSQAMQAKVDELGLALALVPEQQDGAGLDWTSIGGVFEVLGYHAAPITLGETVIANWALAQAGLPLPAGRACISSDALQLSDHHRTVSGTCFVPWSENAEHLVVVAHSLAGNALCLVDLAAAERSPAVTIGRDRADILTFHHCKIVAKSDVVVPADLLRLPMATLRAAQISGALSRILSLSIEYGNTRNQFGRPIGKFQAIQHMIAELAAEAAAAKAGVQIALKGLEAGNGFGPVAVGKARASTAAAKGAAIAHEVFGAIGVTEEHVLHYFTRRLWQWREEAGDEFYWSERLGDWAIDDGGAGLWPKILQICGG